jgi:hypothetical protein
LSTNGEYLASDLIEDCIRSVHAADEREISDRMWELRADAIRKREVFRNFEAIRNATKGHFDRLRAGLPERRLEFTDNPARYFVLYNSAISGVTVNVGMSSDGAVVTVESIRHKSPNDVLPKSTDTVQVGVEGSSTFYLHHGSRVTVSQVADIAMRPVLDSLRARR